MIIYAIVRATRDRREWMSFYLRRELAAEVCASMNAKLNKRTTPYEVVDVRAIP